MNHSASKQKNRVFLEKHEQMLPQLQQTYQRLYRLMIPPPADGTPLRQKDFPPREGERGDFGLGYGGSYLPAAALRVSVVVGSCC